jgi:hypothetical protein
MSMSSHSTQPDSSERITKEQIAERFRSLRNSTDSVVESSRQVALVAGAGFIGLLLVIAFVLGRRGGKKARTIVEVRRF